MSSTRDQAAQALVMARAASNDPETAERAFQQAIALDPGWAVAQNAFGTWLARRDRTVEAVAAFSEAVRRAPSSFSVWWNLARAQRTLGNDRSAFEALEKAAQCRDIDDTLLIQVARELRSLGRADAGAALIVRVADPSATDAAWAGLELVTRKATADACRLLARATEAQPQRSDLWYALGVVAQGLQQLTTAEAAYRRCVELDPSHAEAWNNLGGVLKKMVRFDDAVAAYEAGISARPTKWNTHRNLLFALQYHPNRDAFSVFAAHQRYGMQAARPLPPRRVNRDPTRRLRIGYVSADFGTHPVGHFLLPVWANHDRQQVHVTAYAVPRPTDAITDRLRAAADAWVPVGELDDVALADRVREDGIDILVDLGGHTRGSRVQMFALKPAPIQVTWAGYVGTTGLPTIDWLIGDPRHTPPGAEAFSVERIWRLPRTYVCWEPPDAPPPGPLPMRSVGYPTLACFNNLPKVNRRVVSVWARILRQRTDARLLLVTKALGDLRLAATWKSWFREDGVDPARIETHGQIPREELLAVYGSRVDLALDPFPYSGGLTTLEALWMGVPVVTLGGDRFASRHTLAHLGALGLSGFVASNEEEYVRRVSDTLADVEGLAAVRDGLRARVASSPLCDGPGFTRELETAFRGMWKHWLDQRDDIER